MFRKTALVILLCPIAATAQTPGPMSCSLKAKVISIYPADPHQSGPCSRYPCTARVKILSITDKGSAFTSTANAGDTVDVAFTYTLAASKSIFPGVKPGLKGMKRGNVFSAKASMRLLPGNKVLLVVATYTRN